MMPSSATTNGELQNRPGQDSSAGNKAKSRGSLQARITALVLIVTIPLMIGMILFLTLQARRELIDAANKSLSTASSSITQATDLWLQYNSNALKTLVNSPDIATMNSLWQKPMLKEMATSYPHMYLVSTTDVNGVNRARSDDQPPKNYSDRYWFQNALSNAPVTYETLIGRTSNMPALVVSMPIHRLSDSTGSETEGEIVGVGMFATELSQIADLVTTARLGRGGNALIVDQRNLLITHSDPQAQVMTDLSDYPPVKALREGISGSFNFTDSEGQRIQSYISSLPNGWGVIAHQTEVGLFEPIRQFQQLAFGILIIGALVMSVLTWSTIRQAIRPIQDLTQVAVAISSGDLTRQAAVQTGSSAGRDELGLLALAFNQMTAELRELVGGLENRVAERTQQLERRALQFQVTSEVAREAAAIRETETLLQNVVNLISTRFGFDHAGIFLLNRPEGAEGSPVAADGELVRSGYAILRAASSEGGQRMLERGHQLKIGQQGIVGYVAAAGQPRIALDVGEDAVFFNNPDLPMTRSEIALPLKIQNQVIGVLDVQSNQPSAFSDEDLSILQILADQVALAIENTRLLADSQQAIRELESLYGMQIRQGWSKQLAGEPLVYSIDRQGIIRTQTAASTLNDPIQKVPDGDEHIYPEFQVPIELRGQRIGSLRLRRARRTSSPEYAAWSPQEEGLIREMVSQLALALENARLMEEIQNRASQEALINQIVARTQSSLNMETVMKTAVTEIGRMMRLSRIQLRLGAPDDGGMAGSRAAGPDPDAQFEEIAP